MKPLFFDRYSSYYKNHATIHSCPYDGIVDLLKYIKNSKLKIGVASNKGHDIDGEPKKPVADKVYDVIKHLNVYPHEVLYISDSEPDILVSKHIGLKHIIVTYDYRDKQTLLRLNPASVVDTVQSLTHEIERIIYGSN
ncbi:MAG: HAD family hydrolase [Acholeplasmataceae bacterium]